MLKCSRAVLAFLLVGVLGIYPMLAPAHCIDAARFELIRPGMTRAEVESIFGVPPGEYDWAEEDIEKLIRKAFTVNVPPQGFVTKFGSGSSQDLNTFLLQEKSDSWTSRHGQYTVWYGSDGRVTSMNSHPLVAIVPPWQRFWRTPKK